MGHHTMGIDRNSLNFLRFCHQSAGSFGKTITIGRHGLHITANMVWDNFSKQVVEDVKLNSEYFIDETLKRLFGSTSVDSLDYSDYEGASIVHDLNLPIDDDKLQFDTIIDAGTSEHVFDVFTAIKNVMKLCSIGGTIIQILPANNYCGHGFWQFSPEFFWGTYSSENGFKNTEIFLAKIDEPKRWFRLIELAHAGRANFFSKNSVQLLVKTTKAREVELFKPPQQKDYIEKWSRKNDSDTATLGRAATSSLRAYVNRRPLLRAAKYRVFRTRVPLSMRLNSLNPCIETVNVKELISKS